MNSADFSFIICYVELKLSLNKENFKVGETITIRASLDNVVLEQNVAVSVIDPNNKNVVSRTITVENSDQSSLQFKLVDNSISGTYVVKITSLINGQTISDSTEFTVVSSNSGVEIVSIEPTDQQGNPVTTFTKNKNLCFRKYCNKLHTKWCLGCI